MTPAVKSRVRAHPLSTVFPSPFSRSLARALALTPLFVALHATPARADTPQPGYEVTSQVMPAFAASSVTLPSGDFATFDGQSVDLWDANGAFLQNLASLPTFGFPSFALLSPAGELIVAESSTSKVWRVSTTAGGATLLATLPFAFDAAFAPSGKLYVSAAGGGGNDLLELAIPSGAVTPVGNVAGPSGPLTFDGLGTLYYATQWPTFPAPAGSTDVLSWSAAAVSAGGLSDANATLFCDGLDGAGSLAVDPSTERLFVAEGNFGLGVNFVRRVGVDQASSPIVVDAGSKSILGLHFRSGPSAATFDAYQPGDGPRLIYAATDFFSASERSILRPKRPVMTVSGPGTVGVGAVTLSVTGGVPGGTAFLLLCRQSALFPVEQPQALPTFLWHTRFDPTQTRRVLRLPLACDANGTAVLQVFNTGGLTGLNAYQFMVGGTGGVFIGSSNSVSF